MEQQTIVAAVRPLERFPLLAAAVKERLQQLLEEVVAECREKLEELVQEKESFFIDIGWPATFNYPTVPLGVRVAGSDRWDRYARTYVRTHVGLGGWVLGCVGTVVSW